MGLDYSNVNIIRQEFPALQRTVNDEPVIFFDGPGGTQTHGSVLDAMREYLIEWNSNAHGAFHRSRETDRITSEARAIMADFLNAERPEEIVFGPNMTTLTFRISQAIARTLRSGDELVVTRLDHDANISPWKLIAKGGIAVRSVDFNPDDCTLDMDSLRDAITPRTRVVAIGLASNAVGTINDVVSISDNAHAVGALVYVDAVHYAPHGPIDVQQLGCDFLACSAYKFYGPHLGIVYGRYDLLTALAPAKVVPAGDDPPDKFEVGTGNFEGIHGAAAAVEYLASVGRRFGKDFEPEYQHLDDRRRDLKAGMAAIRSYERDLCRMLLEGLLKVPGITVYGIVDPDMLDWRVPTVSFTLRGMPATEVARRLDEHNIFVWDGHFYAVEALERLGVGERGGLVRVGLAHYNTADEVDAFMEVLSRIAECT